MDYLLYLLAGQYHCSATPASLTNGWLTFDFSSFSNLSQFYNRVLIDQEIKALYEAGR